jgi:predicted transcriptional regulator
MTQGQQLPATSPAPTANKGIPVAQILAFRAKGLTQQQIATLLGCTQQTVKYHLDKADLDGLDNYRDFKDSVFEHVQRDLLNSLCPDDIKAMSGLQKLTGVGILEDKIRVIRGQATEIVEQRVKDARLLEAIERLRQAGNLSSTTQVVDIVEPKE